MQIRQLGISKEAENQDFRRYLSAHHHRIEPFQVLATQIQQQIDCTTCANCCRNSVVPVDESDIDVIARYLGVEGEQAKRLYTVADSDAPTRRVLQSTRDGCIFLDGNLCVIYQARPKACRDFPHVALGVRSLGGRLSSHCRWASLCPIIYNALGSYKHLVGYHRRATGVATGGAAQVTLSLDNARHAASPLAKTADATADRDKSLKKVPQTRQKRLILVKLFAPGLRVQNTGQMLLPRN